MVVMIIKGLFRRYERWNPVHPTLGAFWGMGIGIGCGVGWGPGFGPEVVGYVGAGCGIGFCVGVTVAGLGIGLPANALYHVPYSAILATRSGAVELIQSSSLRSAKFSVRYGWSDITQHILGLQREASRRLTSIKQECLDKKINLPDMKSLPAIPTRSICETLGSLGSKD
ncbi:cadmium-induced protein AS8 isoform X2 [Momordica charantia]|uniref:Cadmium-induced protein AS8 isoform X2 n=1 Tax=Momordica charantia TaxID=3673 RepID=A0A6J1DSI8_MOMCH|nr:cadmium-induced protein AS8 isoform X2 [Momordica charantia]